MTDEQKYLLNKLGSTFTRIAEECERDESFHQIMINNNDLYNQSLDELAAEWNAVADNERK